MRSEPKQPLAQLVLDAVAATLLVVVAATFAGAVKHGFTPRMRWMYSVWFAIGGIPCLLYLRYRRVLPFDRWDVLVFAAMPAAVGIVPAIVGRPYDMVAIGLLLHVCCLIRTVLPPANSPEPVGECPDGRLSSDLDVASSSFNSR